MERSPQEHSENIYSMIEELSQDWQVTYDIKSIKGKELYRIELQMPPDDKLPAEVVASLVKWVELGAPDPRDDQELAALKREARFGEKRLDLLKGNHRRTSGQDQFPPRHRGQRSVR
jgi:hypothetical protein